MNQGTGRKPPFLEAAVPILMVGILPQRWTTTNRFSAVAGNELSFGESTAD